MKNKAVVCLSGGQDSTTALGLALKKYDEVYTIGFDYAQIHEVELKCRSYILKHIERILGTSSLRDDLLVDIKGFGQLSDCALTKDRPIVMNKETNLPSTFVPGRNIIFASYAAAYAYRVGAHTVVLGVSQTDYSGYPDCRQEPLLHLEKSLSLGMDYEISLATPFMFADKVAEWQQAYELGGDEFVKFLVEKTHTCYRGDRSSLHSWGYGCGKCPACELRAASYLKYLDILTAPHG